MLLTATIDHVIPATPRSVVLRLAVPERFPFSAGEAALLGAPGQVRRPYSIAVGPDEAARTGQLEFLVGLGPDGTPGPHLPSPASGDVVNIEGPIGTFRLPPIPPESHVLFVAGGTGIAPLRSMLHEALAMGSASRLSVLYSARTPDEFAFDDELTTLASTGRIRYVKTVTRQTHAAWRGERGRISRAQLERLVERPDSICLVCGPEALVHEVPRMLVELGVDRQLIRVEEWAVPPPATSA